MALVKEDGSIVAGANTLVLVADVKAFATARGIATSQSDTDISAAIIKAMDWIETKESGLQGYRTSTVQETPYPRTGTNLYGSEVGPNVIPKPATSLQCQLAIDVLSGIDISPNETGPQVVEEKVGSLMTKYAVAAGDSAAPWLSRAEGYLALLSRGQGAFGIKTERA